MGANDIANLGARADALIAERRAALAEEVTAARIEERHARCQQCIDTIAARTAAANLDLLVIFGDEDRTLSTDQSLPPFSLYTGTAVEMIPPRSWRVQEHLQPAMWAWYSEQREQHPVAVALGEYLLEGLSDEDFDVASCRGQAEGMSLNTSFSFVLRRVLRGRQLPILPIVLNAQFPPNQPTGRRCYDLGVAVGKLIAAWPSDARVGVIASGGLSHTMVDEAYDRKVLAALLTGDAAQVRALPVDRSPAGTGEVRCWLGAAGALATLQMHLLAYEPCYRSIAGTGCGMAFATWS